MSTLVLDTNVVLDWLVFDDPVLEGFTNAVQDRRVSVLTHSATLSELRRVLNYPALKLDATRQADIYKCYQSLSGEATLPSGFSPQTLVTPIGFPQCRDRDDQLFLALALHTQAHALISRDKALLALLKRALKFGVTIMDVVQLRASVALNK